MTIFLAIMVALVVGEMLANLNGRTRATLAAMTVVSVVLIAAMMASYLDWRP